MDGAERHGVQGRSAAGGAEEEEEEEEGATPAIRQRRHPAGAQRPAAPAVRRCSRPPRDGGEPCGSARCGAEERGAEGGRAGPRGRKGGGGGGAAARGAAERPGDEAGRARGDAALLAELTRLREERERLRERLRELREPRRSGAAGRAAAARGEAREGRRGAAEPCAAALRELHRGLDAALRSQRRALRAVAEMEAGSAELGGTGRDGEAEERRRGGEEGPGRERCGACRNGGRQVQQLLALSGRLEAELRAVREESGELRLRLQLQQQKHRDVVAVYRTLLLSAAQGSLDEAAHQLLLHIAALS